jgi:outer membrane lipoprotein SlyB
MQRYQFSQQIPYQQLQGFLSSVYGTPMSQSQFQTQQPAQTNYLGQGIGGALLGSQVGNLFGGIGGLSGAQTGAILGGLGGLLL